MRRHLAWLCAVGSALIVAAWLAGTYGSRAGGARTTAAEVVIDEVAWAGTAANPADEWIELYNNTEMPVDLSGWKLASMDGFPNIILVGIIPAHGYYLLERSDDCTVSDVTADQPGYTGALVNTGERLELSDDSGILIDTADGSGGWPAGSSDGHYTMERIDPAAADGPANWASNDGFTINGHDCAGNPLNGTPKARNSATPVLGADLRVNKAGPSLADAGALVTYTITLGNGGPLPAYATVLTDVLPTGIHLIAQSAPYPLMLATSGTLVWNLGTVPAGAASITFTVTGQVDDPFWGELTNAVTVTSLTTEAVPADNHDRVTTRVGGQPVLIEALYYRAREYNQPDEAVRLMNVSPLAFDVGGWSFDDGTASAAVLPPATVLTPGQAIWCTHDALAFERQFGFKPDFEVGGTDPAVPALDGTWPGFADDGDECVLREALGNIVDVLVYKAGDTQTPGWSGTAVHPWTSGSSFAATGQILYRKRDQATGLPVPDTDAAADWAQDPGDPIDGRKVLYPGWDLDRFFFTQRITETAVLTVAVAPDNLYKTVDRLLAGARQSIKIESYTFESPQLADRLVERLGKGVVVTVLLEGAPAFEGVSDAERWVAHRLHDAGAHVLFMLNDTEASVHARYENQHSKILVVDGTTALIGSENLNPTSFVVDDKTNGTAGRRGVYLITDAPGVVARVHDLFAVDADPVNHGDVMGCDQVPELCTPPAGFEPEPAPDWITYTVQFTDPLTTAGAFGFEVIHSPENSLRDQDGFLGLLNHAAQGDTLLVEQSAENKYWGPDGAAPASDPNPRLEAYLAAARGGAAVRILLDAHFDGSGDNAATLAYLRDVARAEGLDLQVRLGDPTALGLHNKMVLARIGGRGYVHVGSINGSEASSKVNREAALQVQSDQAYDYLQAVFDYDWRASTPPVYLPVVLRNHAAPQPARDLLISEAYYVTVPQKEWVEIYNPTYRSISLSDYKVGDAANPDDAEGMYRFPSGASLDPGQVAVVAVTAAGFREDFPSQTPDFELFETDPSVPNLQAYAKWGTWDWGLSNSGDEVLLLNGSDVAVDLLVYGTGSYPGVVPNPGGVAYGHSLERVPIWLDTDDCSIDFRDWPFPSPGELP
jgi:uncharacterized repeat protein (TIGR01451 family)